MEHKNLNDLIKKSNYRKQETCSSCIYSIHYQDELYHRDSLTNLNVRDFIKVSDHGFCSRYERKVKK